MEIDSFALRSIVPCLLALACLGTRGALASVGELVFHPAHGPAGTDDDLKKIGEQTEAEELHLGAKVTDAGLGYLKRMKKLRIVFFGGAAITDAGLAKLRDLKDLRELYLQGTRIGDAGLKELAKSHSGLRILALGGTRVTDAGMPYIGKMTDLIVLGLNNRITNAGLKHITSLTKLLDVVFDDNNRVGDAGMSYLCKLPKLHILDLGTCQVADAGLACLKGRKTFRT